ncbi:hypothetical protein COU91_03135 [Candidatus Saccharibacteria bacterium CG10_big_fil_rev_8_21_14_0_10_47_8]|nr:MAG: hypothetical protein COU91_03135 [Candidatus Saccharibacteria bacterium CG10_big_fil_rev_8_21_14_0_10_47_8]
MNKTTTISFNAPQDVKSRLQRMADSYGITISDLMRMSALKVADEGITIEPELEPTPYLEKLMRKVDKDYKAGRNITSFDNAEDAIAHLRNINGKK